MQEETQHTTTEARLDTQKIFQSLVRFHEDVKEMHYTVLSRVGLGDAHRGMWNAIDRARDAGIDMIRRNQNQ